VRSVNRARKRTPCGAHSPTRLSSNHQPPGIDIPSPAEAGEGKGGWRGSGHGAQNAYVWNSRTCAACMHQTQHAHTPLPDETASQQNSPSLAPLPIANRIPSPLTRGTTGGQNPVDPAQPSLAEGCRRDLPIPINRTFTAAYPRAARRHTQARKRRARLDSGHLLVV
jgi:hypothetical protein